MSQPVNNPKVLILCSPEPCPLKLLVKEAFFSPKPPHTMGPCAVQNPTVPPTSKGKSGKAHWDSGFGQTSVFFVLTPFPTYPVTTKIRVTVKERDLKISHTVPNVTFLSKNSILIKLYNFLMKSKFIFWIKNEDFEHCGIVVNLIF